MIHWLVELVQYHLCTTIYMNLDLMPRVWRGGILDEVLTNLL